ncbi:MAG: TonB family protein [Nitrospiria bacterium]
MQIPSLRTAPPSFPYLPCVLLSLIFHLSLFLGLHQLKLGPSSAENIQKEAISFVDLESEPSLPKIQKENIPHLPLETAPSEGKKRISSLPPELSTGSPPDLDESPAPIPEAIPDTPSPAPEPPHVSSESSNTVAEEATPGEPPPASDTGIAPEETSQATGTAKPASSSTPGEADLEREASADTAKEDAGGPEEAGEVVEEEISESSAPLSPPLTAKSQKKVPSRKKPTKDQVKKVGLLGLLGKKSPAMGSSVRKLRLPSAITKNTKRSFPAGETESPPGNKNENITKLRNKVLQEEQSRLTRRGNSRPIESSDLRIIQGSSRNYGIISSSVQIKRSRLKTVYNDQLLNSPNLEGNVIIEFVVSPAGTVLKCNILTSSLGNPEFEDALIKEILQWRFPSVKKGTTTILFPISFFPAG